jgi:amidase
MAASNEHANVYTNGTGDGSLSWQEKARLKRESVNGALPAKWKLPQPASSKEHLPDQAKHALGQWLSDVEIDITENYTAIQLADKLGHGVFTATEVTEAFCHRTTIAHQFVGPYLTRYTM